MFAVRTKTSTGEARLTIAADTREAAIQRVAELGEVVIDAEALAATSGATTDAPLSEALAWRRAFMDGSPTVAQAPAPSMEQREPKTVESGVANGIIKAALVLFLVAAAIGFLLWSCQNLVAGKYDAH